MNRLSYIFLPLTAIGMSACSSGKEEVKRPNIIFMMTDDHTTQAMSCYGGRFLQTPNMDRIANEGVRMDNCYAVNALSGPSRACILTGKFSTSMDSQTMPALSMVTNRPSLNCCRPPVTRLQLSANGIWLPSLRDLTIGVSWPDNMNRGIITIPISTRTESRL